MSTPFFTAKNSREMQALSVESRRVSAQLVMDAFKDPASIARVTRLRRQLERLDSLIAKATDGKTLSDLTSAQSRLFEQYCRYTGLPRPGIARGRRNERRVIEIGMPQVAAPASAPETPAPEKPQ